MLDIYTNAWQSSIKSTNFEISDMRNFIESYQVSCIDIDTVFKQVLIITEIESWMLVNVVSRKYSLIVLRIRSVT
jgi:hypothetical protein